MSIKRTPGMGTIRPHKPAPDSNDIAVDKAKTGRVSAQSKPDLPARGLPVSSSSGSSSSGTRRKRTALPHQPGPADSAPASTTATKLVLPKVGNLQLAGSHPQHVLDKATDVAVRGLGKLYRALSKRPTA
jgi:hypothetical protein